MKLFALTELGFVCCMETTGRNQRVLENVIVLDIDKATFSIEYTSSYVELVKDTITENPKEIYDRLSSAKQELEKRELALMKNLFIIDKNKYSLDTLTKKRKPRIKKITTEE